MKGAHKFSPSSGAALSRDRRYPGTIPLREAIDGSGELTNGRLVSNGSKALLGYFRRTHQEHAAEDVGLYRRAAVAIQSLRKQDPWDCWLWYALAERLHREEFDIEWMLGHADARCPRCGSQLKWEPAASGYPFARCASSCSRDRECTIEITDTILELYNAVFDEPIDRLTFF